MQRIGFIVLPGFQVMSFAAASVFEFANRELGEPVYDVRVISETGGSIRSSIGVSVATEPFDDTNFDTLIVGGSAVVGALTPGVIRFLQQALGRCRRVAATCTGAFILAEAGLLDGRRATTHWNRARELQARFPNVKLEEDRIFIVDGPVWTSAGMTAGIDLALAMIEKDLGADVARAVARKLVVYHRRAGGQSQFSVQLAGPVAHRPSLRELQSWIHEHPESDLGVEALAKRIGMSPRNFARTFTRELAVTPARYVERARVEAARQWLEDSRTSLDEVAAACGFGSAETLRRAFQRLLRVSPSAYRDAFARSHGTRKEVRA